MSQPPEPPLLRPALSRAALFGAAQPGSAVVRSAVRGRTAVGSAVPGTAQPRRPDARCRRSPATRRSTASPSTASPSTGQPHRPAPVRPAEYAGQYGQPECHGRQQPGIRPAGLRAAAIRSAARVRPAGIRRDGRTAAAEEEVQGGADHPGLDRRAAGALRGRRRGDLPAWRATRPGTSSTRRSPRPAPRRRPHPPRPPTTDAPAPKTITIVEPKTLGGRPKLTDPQFADVAKELQSGLADVPGATNTVGALYGTPAKQDIIVIAGVEAPIDNPTQELNGTFLGAGVGGLEVTGISTVDPGPLGGVANAARPTRPAWTWCCAAGPTTAASAGSSGTSSRSARPRPSSPSFAVRSRSQADTPAGPRRSARHRIKAERPGLTEAQLAAELGISASRWRTIRREAAQAGDLRLAA